MSETYCVRIDKDDLVFSAAHFITYGENTCESLHGHNYRVAAEVRGPLDEQGLVVDFIALHQRLAAILSELDHRVLLPTQHPRIEVAPGKTEVRVAFEGRRWVFPREDCSLLPLCNTTAELLARYIAERLRGDLAEKLGIRPSRVRVEVDENYGQRAACELGNDAQPPPETP